MSYKRPGVFVKEISKFPPSVAQVETAIPAFIGYTAAGPANAPTRISSLMEYEKLFGKYEDGKDPVFAANEANIEVKFTGTVAEAKFVATKKASPYKMYYALQMYFANGGGPCYIVSVGTYVAPSTEGVYPAITKDALIEGLNSLQKEDEPTLIVFTDASGVDKADYYKVYDAALGQAKDLQDRFVLIDTRTSDKVTNDNFYGQITSNVDELRYGAAYYPHLKTILGYAYAEDKVTISGSPKKADGSAIDLGATKTLAVLKGKSSAAYQAAKAAIASALRVEIAPSAAMAGVYAKVDSSRGVWKAPANVSLNYVVAPSVKISNADQELLNAPDSGKAINAIRSFTGKGTMVWGARTLDANDNEWRYVPVRRFFNMVEESVKKATERFVFEPNDANTWVRVKAMIENYLTQQWRDGALAGATPEEAFYVSIGLGETMSAQEVLEGKMNIEIGMAAVRPAEFIVLKFSHKLQES